MKYRELVMRYRPAGYWPLDETAKTSAVDRTKRGADGSRVGTLPELGFKAGMRGRRAADFVAGGSIQIADADRWSITDSGELTVVAWAKMDVEDSSANTVVARRNNNTGTPFEWIMRQLSASNALNASLTDSGGADVADATGGSMVINQWYMVAFTAKSATTRIVSYLNGAEVGSDSTWAGLGTWNSTSPLFFGWWGNGDTGQQFDGLIFDVAIFPRVLGAGVLQRLWAAGRRGDR